MWIPRIYFEGGDITTSVVHIPVFFSALRALPAAHADRALEAVAQASGTATAHAPGRCVFLHQRPEVPLWSRTPWEVSNRDGTNMNRPSWIPDMHLLERGWRNISELGTVEELLGCRSLSSGRIGNCPKFQHLVAPPGSPKFQLRAT